MARSTRGEPIAYAEADRRCLRGDFTAPVRSASALPAFQFALDFRSNPSATAPGPPGQSAGERPAKAWPVRPLLDATAQVRRACALLRWVPQAGASLPLPRGGGQGGREPLFPACWPTANREKGQWYKEVQRAYRHLALTLLELSCNTHISRGNCAAKKSQGWFSDAGSCIGSRRKKNPLAPPGGGARG